MGRFMLADKGSLSDLRRAIRADLVGAGMDPSDAFDCLVSVTEACTNALLHGRETEEHSPEITWDIHTAAVVFCVRDYSALKWSRTKHPSRHLEEDFLEDARFGGFGLDVMRRLMDDVRIDVSAQGTEVCMTKRMRMTASV
jgi:serine/threonine-protein kinase RsbW